MEKGSAVLEVVFRSNVQATTTPLAAAVAEANASVLLREGRAVKASTVPLAVAVAEPKASVVLRYGADMKSPTSRKVSNHKDNTFLARQHVTFEQFWPGHAFARAAVAEAQKSVALQLRAVKASTVLFAAALLEFYGSVLRHF